MRGPRPVSAVAGLATVVRLLGAALWLPRELHAAQRLMSTPEALPLELAILADESAEVLFAFDPLEVAPRSLDTTPTTTTTASAPLENASRPGSQPGPPAPGSG